jgi:catechol 2,3-dioxygenase-like lactoylglutathione lyase family enzyme
VPALWTFPARGARESFQRSKEARSMSWALGHVGHFGLAVPDPRRSARWWIENLAMRLLFDFADAVGVENDAITIVFHPGSAQPGVLGHMSFHLQSMEELREALADLRAQGVDLEDPGDEIGPESADSPNMGVWFRDPDGYRWELSVQGGAAERPS